jgi:hypothetical protein
VRLFRALAGLSCAVSIGAGCSGGDDGPPTEQEIKTEFDAFVASHNRCVADTDCVLVSPECPLGCFAAVESGSRVEVEEKAHELVRRYERGCSCSCAYDCISAVAGCREGRCEVVPD